MNTNRDPFTHALRLCLIISALFLACRIEAAEAKRYLSLSEIIARWQKLPASEVEAAAKSGDLSAQHYLGYYYHEGVGGVTNQALGLQWYRQAAEKGFPNSMNNLAVAYLRGKGVPKDKEIAFRWFDLVIEQRFPLGWGNVVSLLRSGEYPPDRAPALKRALDEAAYAGDPDAMMILADYLSNPPINGVARDEESAVYFYKKAYALGRVDACYHLGRIYQTTSVQRFSTIAAEWYKLGETKGDRPSKLSYAWLQFNGFGLKQDPEAALRRTAELAEQGFDPAFYMLGRYYSGFDLSNPSPIPQDMAKAMSWFRKAADAGNVNGMFALGSLLFETADLAQRKEGIEWLLKAESRGHRDAKKKVAHLAYTQPDLIPQGQLKIEDMAYNGYQDYQDIMVQLLRAGKRFQRDDFQAAFWLFISNLGFPRHIWQEVPGLTEDGGFDAKASSVDQEFGKVYSGLAKAFQGRQSDFFKVAAKGFEQGEGGRAKNQIFATLCYELAGAFGDQEAKSSADKLRAEMDDNSNSHTRYLLRGFLVKFEK